MSERWVERLAERVLAACAGSDGAWLVGDLREELARRTMTDGALAARRWYLREVLTSIPPLLRRRLAAISRPREPMPAFFRGDFAYAWRLARRSPLGSAAIVLTMVIGIGATTAVFSVVNAVLLQPLPFPGSEHVVQLSANVRGRVGNTLAYPDLVDFRARVSSFAEVSGMATTSLTLQDGDHPQLLRAIRVDEAYGRIFAIRPLLGRYFVAAEMQPGAPRVAMLTHAIWRRNFGGDSGVVGRTLTIDHLPYTVVGVLPETRFLYPIANADLLVPLRVRAGTMFVNRGAMWITAIARLRDGVSDARAAAELDRVSRALIAENPRTNDGTTAQLTPLRDIVVGGVQRMLLLMVLAMAGVLLVTCLNVGSLLLGKAQARAREFAVRAAMGGSASRLRSQIFAEGFLLAAIGGGLGLLLAPVLTRALLAVYPSGLPRAGEVGIDLRVLAITAGATFLSGLLSVLPLARRAARVDLANDLRDGGRSGTSGRARRAGNALVMTQVAVCVALLFASTLLITTLRRLNRLDVGFDPKNTLTFQVSPQYPRVQVGGDVERYFTAIAAGVAQLPGVEAVASAEQVPMGNAQFSDVFVNKDLGDRGRANPSAQVAAASAGFDRALGLRLLRGRAFTAADDSAAERVLVIDETLARSMWPGENPLGRVISWNLEDWRVVGIVRATRDRALWDAPPPRLYAPSTQRFAQTRYVVVRSSALHPELLDQIRQVIRGIDPTAALSDVATMEERMGAALAAQRFRALLIATLAAITLSLCALGIYGVVASAVGQRRREIGIRIALGETAGGVRRRILGGAVATCATGATGGIVLALGTGRWLGSLLFEITPTDAPALTAVSVGIIVMGAVAAYVPARRASRVDPADALRND